MHADYPLTVYFDGACLLCRSEIENLALRDRDHRLVFVDASAPGFTSPLEGVGRGALLTIIHATRPDGSVVRGVDVFELAYRAVGLAWVSRVLALPVIAPLARRAYPWIARNRHRLPRTLVMPLFGVALRRAARGASACREGEACRIES